MPKSKRRIDSSTRLAARNIRLLLQYRGWSHVKLAQQFASTKELPSFDASAISRYLAIADSKQPAFTSLPLSFLNAVSQALTVTIDSLLEEDFEPALAEAGVSSVEFSKVHVVDTLYDNPQLYLRTVRKHEEESKGEAKRSWLAFDFAASSIPHGGIAEEFYRSMSNAPMSFKRFLEIHKDRHVIKHDMNNILLTERFEWFLRRLAMRRDSESKVSSRSLAEKYLGHIIKQIQKGLYYPQLIQRRRVTMLGCSELLRFTAVAVINEGLVILRMPNQIIFWSEYRPLVNRYLEKLYNLSNELYPLPIRYNSEAKTNYSLNLMKRYLERVRAGEFGKIQRKKA